MRLRILLGELVVPALVLLGTALFFASIREAPSVTQRVPLGVMAFILAMTGIVVVRAVLDARAGGGGEPPPPVSPERLVREWGPRVVFVLLAVGYYLLFERIGFSLSNFVFLLAALPLAGYGRGRSFAAAAARIVAIAAVATVIFHVLAIVMHFNVPVGPLGF